MKLVKERKCYISKGQVYVTPKQMPDVFAHRLRRILEKSFELVQNREGLLQTILYDDNRIGPFIRQLHQYYCGTDGKTKTNAGEFRLSLENLPRVAPKAFPLCMKRLYETQTHSGHLRHWSRLQLWLFLKECGMTVDEQLRFGSSTWKGTATFEKEHKYTLRHAYGLEGRRQDYPSYACNRILHTLPAPSQGDVHGCPFKTLNNDNLRKSLEGMATNVTISEILKLTSEYHYQIACKTLFESMHGTDYSADVGNHPRQYFNAAMANKETS
eukprot:GHVO01009601.1.p1 GENE.GHVO01009601.1~~GHVO01009601.1.p1  ORF type:complete len:270 (+),score=30.34 GHVO01009601.1:212-1021(+)